MFKMTAITRNLYSTFVTGRYVGIIFVLLLATSFIAGVNGIGTNGTTTTTTPPPAPTTTSVTTPSTEVITNGSTTITTTNPVTTTQSDITTASPPSTTSNSSANVSSTAAPLTSTTHPTSPASSTKQHFDAASFIGGIILCAGVIAIVFFGCKFYKARTSSTVARY
ncbi:porimin isoform X2 [Octopus sinensis]|uniref:Porimin isoform X2 n=1 Tax=Octopus sinensis TaxID=2607531 RepID=A0A6P7TGR6_9MOLL|nr:porimin isoform X2 [Octopus sinensis]